MDENNELMTTQPLNVAFGKHEVSSIEEKILTTIGDTLQLKLAMMDNEHGFPVALGVIRDVAAPTYEDCIYSQIKEVKARKRYHNFTELLETNDIWTVE